jgi:hypothetical protein
MNTSIRRILSCIAAGVLALVASCASTTLQSAWTDPTYTGPGFTRILVVGVTGSMANRRVFDDMFAQSLNAAGVDGLPGYQFIPDAASANEQVFNEGVANSKADGLLLVRLLGVDTKTQVNTTMMPAMGLTPMMGPYGGYAGWGPAWYAVPSVQQYQVANVEATLFETKTHRPVWSGSTQTLNPTSVAAETPGYAKVVIGQLVARGLIAAKK